MQHRYTLSPSQKAAAVLIAMGKPRAKQLLKYFKGEELKRMIEAGHALKTLPQTDVDQLVTEFEAAFVEGTGIIDSSDAIDAIIDTSSNSRGVSGGSSDGNRCANMDFPDPGGPTIRRLCPPAAATSSARFAVS